MKQSVEILHDSSLYFYPWQLADVVDNVESNVVLIDLRDKFSFGQGHIPGSENISAYDLTEENNIEHLNELKSAGITVVFYGNDQLQANGPWMWFRQTGFDNVKILLGGYNYYKAHKNRLSQTKSDKGFMCELPRYDYAKAASKKASKGVNNTVKKKKPVVVRRKKRTVTASGGC
jgi:3-mercaptopyruvate sulfurtransferase SseA